MKTVIVYDDLSSFVQQDIDILKCDSFHFTKNYVKEFRFFIQNRYDRYIIYFCNAKALIPLFLSKIRGGEVIIFVGGYDAVYMPKINYGAMHGVKGLINKLIYKLSDRIIISSGEELGDHLLDHVYVDYDVIHCGIDTSYWKPKRVKRDIDYITVGAANAWWRKGMDNFISLARRNPTKTFVTVNCGQTREPNIISYDYLTRDELKILYNRSKHYCQLSRYESFGIALAEAMSMGCLPIVTNVGIMKKIAGNVKSPKEARQRIIDNYDISIRKEKLLNL